MVGMAPLMSNKYWLLRAVTDCENSKFEYFEAQKR